MCAHTLQRASTLAAIDAARLIRFFIKEVKERSSTEINPLLPVPSLR